jgi:hypothetical protein
LNLRDEIITYSEGSYRVEHVARCVCASCATRTFEVCFDEVQGVAGRRCASCHAEHWLGDSEEYLDEADELDVAVCTCGCELFEVMVGVALYQGSDDVRWCYLGCQCTQCGLAGVYADWKNEFTDYVRFLAMI